MHHKTKWDNVCTKKWYGITNKGLAVCISNLLLMIPQNSCFDWSLILWTSGSADWQWNVHSISQMLSQHISKHKHVLGTKWCWECPWIVTKLLQLQDSEYNKSLWARLFCETEVPVCLFVCLFIVLSAYWMLRLQSEVQLLLKSSCFLQEKS